jgi:hypothetical protein
MIDWLSQSVKVHCIKKEFPKNIGSGPGAGQIRAAGAPIPGNFRTAFSAFEFALIRAIRVRTSHL